MLLKELAGKFPYPIQQGLKHIYGSISPKIRYGKVFWDTYNFLQKAQWWDKEKIEKWQLYKLKQIVKYAYKNVLGYHSLYKNAGVKPSDIQTLKDVIILPFITKEEIRDNLEDFTSKLIPKEKRIYVTTGGSTGIPFGFYKTNLNTSIENAYMCISWERATWKVGDSLAVVKGAFIGSEEKFWEYNPHSRELLLSSYYLTEKTFDKYIEKILKYKPLHLQAYPSTAIIFADLIQMKKESGNIIFKVILLGSENIYDWQKQKLLKVFPGTKLFGWYGHAEQAIFAPMCEYSDQYHIWPFYGFTEILNEKGHEVEGGEIGELIGTSFWDYATPFIRYRTKDIAKKGNFGCNQCGRQFQLLEKIEGRLQEIIVTKTGRYISMTAINMHSNVFDNIKQFQFFQEEKGKVIFNIVRKNNYTEKDTEYIYNELKKKLGNDTELKINFVDSIPRTKSGKYRFLIQKLPIKFGE